MAQAVVWVTILTIITIIVVYVLRNFRDRDRQKDTTSDHLTKFRELRLRGVLSDKEFRTIKTAMSEKCDGELKSDAGEG